MDDSCPLCGRDDASVEIARTRPRKDEYIYVVSCSVCGSFSIPRPLARSIRIVQERGDANGREIPSWLCQPHLLSGHTREADRPDHNPLPITEENGPAIIAVAPKDVSDRIDRLLLNFSKRSEYPGDEVTVRTDLDYPLGYCSGQHEFEFYLQALKRADLAKPTRMKHYQVTTRGWMRVSQMERTGALSKQAFVAMSFADDLKPAYDEGIEPAIDEAGFDPLHIGRLHHVDPIDARILKEIKRSRFMVADVTGQNQGVYFEAGYGLANGLTVIWTCREDDFENAHFDTEHFNHIIWSSENELRDKLLDRIAAVVGEGQRPMS